MSNISDWAFDSYMGDLKTMLDRLPYSRLTLKQKDALRKRLMAYKIKIDLTKPPKNDT